MGVGQRAVEQDEYMIWRTHNKKVSLLLYVDDLQLIGKTEEEF